MPPPLPSSREFSPAAAAAAAAAARTPQRAPLTDRQSADQFSACQLGCAAEKAAEICQTSDWNRTECLCTADFQQSVKVCLYRHDDDCNTHVAPWFENVRGTCKEKGVEVKNATKNWSKANDGGDGPHTAPVEGNGNGNPTTSAAAAAASETKDGSAAARTAVGAAAVLVAGAVAAAL